MKLIIDSLKPYQNILTIYDLFVFLSWDGGNMSYSYNMTNLLNFNNQCSNFTQNQLVKFIEKIENIHILFALTENEQTKPLSPENSQQEIKDYMDEYISNLLSELKLDKTLTFKIELDEEW